MDFGRLEDDEIGNIEVKFPKIIPLATTQSRSELHLALPVWGSDHFRGQFYPATTKKSDSLKVYSEVFNQIELNPTHYSIPSRETIRAWKEEVSHNPNFLFFPKLTKSISHEGRLDHHFDQIQAFTDSIREFGNTLGTSFLQLHPSFTPSRIQELIGFFDLWPSDLKLAVEVRHLAWFKNGEVRDALTKILRERNITWIVTDTPGIQDVLHQTMTTEDMFIRFVTTGFHEKDRERMRHWSEQFKNYAKSGVKNIYFFVHERDEWHCREILEYMVQLNSHLSVKEIPTLKDEEQQLSLF